MNDEVRERKARKRRRGRRRRRRRGHERRPLSLLFFLLLFLMDESVPLCTGKEKKGANRIFSTGRANGKLEHHRQTTKQLDKRIETIVQFTSQTAKHMCSFLASPLPYQQAASTVKPTTQTHTRTHF